MEKQEMNESTSSRRLLPPLSPSTFNVPRAGNSHHNHYYPFQHNPAASAAAHFASQAGPGCKAGSSSYQQPPSLLSPTTHASAGVGGISNTVSQDIVSGSGWAAGSSSNQTPPLPLPQTHAAGGNSGGVVDGGSAACDTSNGALSVSFFQMPPPLSPAPLAMDTNPTSGGGHASFFSSPGTGLGSVEGLAPLSWSVDQASSESGLPAPLLTQSMASFDFGLTEEFVLPPLPPTLGGPPPFIDLEAVQYVDLEVPGGHLNSSGRDWGSTSTKAPCPPLPQPHSSGYTCNTQAPWTPLPLTSSSSMPAPVTNFGVKKEVMDWGWGTSQLGKNTITSAGSSSAWMPQPYSSSSTDLMVFGSKPNQLNSPVVVDFADGSFTQNDIDKIMKDKDLKAIVLKDPKKVRSLLRNRSASERSRQKRMMHVSDLEHEAVLLQEENKLLSAQMHSLQSKAIGLRAENDEMRIKLYGFQEETQMKIALNETLNAEVHRLKLVVGEIRGPPMSNSSYQERSPQTTQADHPKIHNHQLAQIQQDQEMQELDNFITQ